MKFINSTTRLLQCLWRLFGYSKSVRLKKIDRLKVLVIGGFGYGNTGDEAQLGANLQLWKNTVPDADITILSPNPSYTFKQHKIRSEFASRVVFFNADSRPHYGRSDKIFRRRFWLLWPRMILNVHLMRAGMAPFLATSEEAALLLRLHAADVLHVSGGGFLTGMTQSRLWDTCLVMKLCQYLGTPYFLTGQTIGVFQTKADRWLAKTALAKAMTISLRDPESSKQELIELGMAEEKMISSVDDALFCEKTPDKIIYQALTATGLDVKKDFVCVNYHYWGMDENTQKKSAQRLAALLDQLIEETDTQVIFIPMVQTDEAAQQTVMSIMKRTATLLKYDYDYRVVRAVIGKSRCLLSFKHHPLIFALGEGVPAMSVSLDDYYWRKNYGSMRNFDQQKLCVHGENFYTKETNNLIRMLYSDSEIIKKGIIDKCNFWNSNRYNFMRKNIIDVIF